MRKPWPARAKVLVVLFLELLAIAIQSADLNVLDIFGRFGAFRGRPVARLLRLLVDPALPRSGATPRPTENNFHLFQRPPFGLG